LPDTGEAGAAGTPFEDVFFTVVAIGVVDLNLDRAVAMRIWQRKSKKSADFDRNSQLNRRIRR